MEMINKVIMVIMMSFMVIAAIDRILNQFGGAEVVLSKVGLGALGRSFAGAGKIGRASCRERVLRLV